MIRFVDLRTTDTGYKFAFWNTVVDRFVSIGPDQAWDSIEDLEDSAKYNKATNIGRLSRLCPDWVPKHD